MAPAKIYVARIPFLETKKPFTACVAQGRRYLPLSLRLTILTHWAFRPAEPNHSQILDNCDKKILLDDSRKDAPGAIKTTTKSEGNQQIIDNGDDETLSDDSRDGAPSTIKITQRRVKVVWQDSTHNINVSEPLDMDVNIDTSRNCALFTLHCIIFCTDIRDSHFYMFIYPEDVKSITFEDTYPNVVSTPNMSIRFVMSNPPFLEIPPECIPKPQSLHMLQTLRTLASLRDFTIYMDTFNFSPGRRALFSSLESVFLNHNLRRPSTQATVEQVALPVYEELGSPAQLSVEPSMLPIHFFLDMRH